MLTATQLEQDREEGGAVVVLVAASLLFLMGFAAIAVDIGAGFNERRQDQSAADFGALAAVQFAKPSTGCSSSSACAASARINGASEAISVASTSLDDPGAADWTDAARCETPPTGFNTVSSVSECVAFNDNAQQAWMRIPTISKPTTFGKTLGVSSLQISADAVAGTRVGAPGDVIPFLLPGNATGADHNCLKTGGNPNWGACEELPETGNFGSMDFFLYGNHESGSTQKCNGDTNGRLVFNIARGIDHPLGVHPTGTGSGKEEPTMCGIFSAEPDMVQGQPGVGSALEDGMLYGDSAYSTVGPYDGRIEDSDGHLVRNAQGSTPAATIDDTPLWTYLASGLGPPCEGVNDPDGMVDCIAWGKDTGTVLFTDAIKEAARFGFTPEIWEDEFGTPGYYYHIAGYRPIYIDSTMFGCDASSCSTVHTPGVADTGPCGANPNRTTCGTPGPGNKNLAAVTAYILSTDIMPDIAKTPLPGAVNQRSHNLIK